MTVDHSPGPCTQAQHAERRGWASIWRRQRIARGPLGLLLAVLMFQPTQVRADERIEARRHFQAGMALIQVGRYLEGIEELEIAYRVLPHPSVLFNIGRAYLDANMPAPALEVLEHYLATDPPDGDEALALIARGKHLEAEQQAQARLGSVPEMSGETGLETHAGAPPMGGAASNSSSTSEPPPMSERDLEALARQLQAISARLSQLAGVRASGDTVEAAGGTAAEAAETGGQQVSLGEEERSKDAEPSGLVAAQAGQEDPGESVPGSTDRPGRPELVEVARTDAADPYAPVVITSSRYRQDPLDAPNALTVLSAGDLRRAGVRTLPDLLRQVPGLEVMTVSPGDFNVGIRGFNSTLANKVLVLVDGRSVYLDFVGASLWPLLSISLSDVERVEIIRGPGAALYGANAFSGVVNIITRVPGAASDRSQLTLRGGSPDWTQADIHLTGRDGSFAYRATAGLELVDRWAVSVDPDRADYVINAAWPDQASHVKRFDARVDRRLGTDVSLSLSGGIAAGQVEFTAIGALRDFFVDGSYGYLRGDLELPRNVSVRAFWNRFDAVASPWATPVGSLSLRSHPETDIFDLETEWYRELRAGVDHKLNVGIGYRYKSIVWEWLGTEPKEHHFSLFAQDELRLSSNLSGVVSLRIDRHPVLAAREGTSLLERFPVSPRGALVWKFAPGQSVRGTVGTAFRTPTFLENYIQQPIPTTNDAVVVLNQGNLELAPERIVSTEIGYLGQPASSLYQVEAAAYLNQVSELVQLSSVEPWSDPSTMYDSAGGYWFAGTSGFANVEERYTAVGGELGGRLFPMDGLDLYANYAYAYIQRGAGDGAKALRSTSPHKLNAGLHMTNRLGLSFGTDVHFVSGQVWQLRSFDDAGQVVLTDVPLPAYTWVGLRLGYVSPDGRLELSLEGMNILDLFRDAEMGSDGTVPTPAKTHREYPLGQPIPVNVAGSVGYRF